MAFMVEGKTNRIKPFDTRIFSPVFGSCDRPTNAHNSAVERPMSVGYAVDRRCGESVDIRLVITGIDDNSNVRL